MRLRRHDAPREPRTYRELIELGRPSCGTCVSCHEFVPGGQMRDDGGRARMFSLGRRANICRACCERKGEEVMGSVRRAECAARGYVRRYPNMRKEAKFIASVTGASIEFVREEIARQQKSSK